MGFVDRTGIEVIERRECLQLLAGTDFGRIGIVEGTHPLILPVNYALVGEHVVFRTAEGTKLDAVRRGHACFEIDHHDSTTREGWSVVVRGRLDEVPTTDTDTYDQLKDQAHPWAEGARDHVVRLIPDSITGRRVTQPST